MADSRHELLNVSGSDPEDELLKRVSSAKQSFSAVRHQGHEGKLTCVDGSDGMDYVVTGADDHTARVWHWDSEHFRCYKLLKTLHHHSMVNSVAFVGKDGPVVTVTDRDLAVWSWHHSGSNHIDHVVQSTAPPASSKGNYYDVDAKHGSDHKYLLLAVAVGNEAKLLDCEADGKGSYAFMFRPGNFRHSSDVQRVLHVPGAVDVGAAIAAFDASAIHLWSSDGKLQQKLAVPGCQIASFSVSTFSSDTTTGWIVAGGASEETVGFASLWPVRGGQVIGKDNLPVPEYPSPPPEPLVQYEIDLKVIDVAIDPGSKLKDAEFIAVSKDDQSTEVITIKPQTLEDAVSQIEPGKNIAQNKKEETLFEVQYQTLRDPVDMCVYRDDESGPVLLAAFESTCWIWDVEGEDAGEKISELRSVRILEIIAPVGMMLATFVQVVGFAFGPATSWSEEVDATMNVTRKVAVLDMTLVIHIDKSLIFLPSVCVMVSCMALFLLLTFTAAPEKLRKWKSRVQRSEVVCMPFLKGFLGGLRQIVALFMGACSTVLVVPLFKICANCFDCVHHPDGGRRPFLSIAPRIVCYNGFHRKLEYVLVVLASLFFVALIPHATVSGDVDYVQRSSFCSLQPWNLWKENSIRRATLIDLGPVHPDHVFSTGFVQLLSKIALPCISILTTSRPILQTASIACIGALLFIHSLLLPPLVDPTSCAIMQGAHLFTFLAMAIGFATVFLPDYKHLSTFMLIFSALFVCTFILCRMRQNRQGSYGLVDNPMPSARVLSYRAQGRHGPYEA
jgi:WD40 repeat protein